MLHVLPTYLPATRYGGPIYSVHGLCRGLAALGHDVHVFTTNVDGPGLLPVALGEPVECDGVKVWYFPTSLGRRLFRSPDMARALKRDIEGFDILHLHSVFLWPTTAAAHAARRVGVPYVLTPRGMLVESLIRRRRAFLKRVWISVFEERNLWKAAAVHVTAQIEADELRKLGLCTQRIVVVSNGIDLPLSIPKDPQISYLAGIGRPLVLSLGRLNWKKGLDRLIQAMRYIPEAHLMIAGNDEEGYQRKLQSLACEHFVVERTHFVGPVHGQQKWQLLCAADLFVLPSYSENFGNVALEAMACGVPVIVTQEVGLARTIEDARAGLVVGGEPQAIGTAIARLLANPAESRRMGERGRRIAQEKFAWHHISLQMEQLYEQCLTSKKHPVGKPDANPHRLNTRINSAEPSGPGPQLGSHHDVSGHNQLVE